MVIPIHQRWRSVTGLLLVIATLVLAACSTGTGLATPGTGTPGTGTAVTGTAGTTTQQQQQAMSILQHAQNAGLRDATFTLTITGNGSLTTGATSSGSATPFTAAGKGKLTTSPKQVQIAFDSLAIAGLATPADVISTNQKIYVKIPELGKWISLDSSQAVGLNTINDVLGYALLQNAQLLGTENVNGVQAYHLRSSAPLATTETNDASGTATHTTDLWLRQDTYFPLKMVTHVTAQGNGSLSNTGGTPQAGNGTPVAGSTTLDQTIIFTAWNTGVTISPPSASEIQSAPIP